jgi:DtxR family Mn-dependent transcriptional regulator
MAIMKVANRVITTCQGDRGRITAVVDTSKDFLKYLDKHHIELGSAIEVLEREDF